MAKTYLARSTDLNLKKTFECGQCFRWDAREDGAFYGAAYGRALKLWEKDGFVFCDAPEKDLSFWRRYFDLDADYAALARPFAASPYLRECAAFGSGIRILRQEPWEALCSFLISQCNNIPRIKAILRALCGTYGEPLAHGLHSFPSPARLAPLSEADLAPLRCGYRTAYIVEAAKRVDEGLFDLDELEKLPEEEAFFKVRQLPGVGAKVANCFLLYGQHRMACFPVDVWMRRALDAHFPPDFDPATLGPGAGLAQQYIFYYAREHGKTPKRENCNHRKS